MSAQRFQLWLCAWFGHGGNLVEVHRNDRSSLCYCFRCSTWEQCDLPEGWVQS